MKNINGILLLYHHYLAPHASTIMDHVNAFEKYSNFNVWKVKTEYGFPKELSKLAFNVIAFHYSLFETVGYKLNKEYIEYLDSCKNDYRIAFFQDEHHYCKQRFEFLNRHKTECVFSCLEKEWAEKIYKNYSTIKTCVNYIPGYVSDGIIKASKIYNKPFEERHIDVGYRGRQLYYYMGRGSQEKYLIGSEFSKRAKGSGLMLDVDVREGGRLYGEKWYKFVAECKGMLGVEAGASVFDLEDIVRNEYKELISKYPKMIFNQYCERSNYLKDCENRIPYRTISPRHFEAAAFKVCQILFEGKYSGIMQPMVHYIPLKKDFSNYDDVMKTFKDDGIRRQIVENAHRDMIESGKYTFEKHIQEFDNLLNDIGVVKDDKDINNNSIQVMLDNNITSRRFKAWCRSWYYRQFPGRKHVVYFVKPVVTKTKKMLESHKWL